MADQSSLSPGRLLLLPALSVALLATTSLNCQLEPADAAMLGSSSHRFAESYRTPKRAGSKPPITKLNHPPRGAARATSARSAPASGQKAGGKQKAAQVKKPAAQAIAPQLYLDKLNKLTLKPGVVHRFFNGPLNINVVEVDMDKADVKVRPYLASSTFDRLKNVDQHARESGALVAVNANYFKKDGTPLGTIKVDDEWVSGSLFNRVAMGITRDGDLKFARVNLHGILETSNPRVPRLWVNNMNQPRRTGARLVMYTRRWGNSVTLPYDGRLVAVSNKGEVLDTQSRSLTIPYGGYVLTDRKESELAHLRRGDFVALEWQTDPKNWNQVTHAISGGPTLIKDGNLFVGLKDEQFHPNWTSAKITRRTACGATADRRLVLATVEGPHTLWDLAKFMKQLGCVEAMNLDGGGSTTMVVNGNTVTRNDTTEQRKVAATLTVMEPHVAQRHERRPDAHYQPMSNLTEFIIGNNALYQFPMMTGAIQARIQQRQLAELTLAGDSSGKFLGIDQQYAPPESIDANGIVGKLDQEDTVIDIDNDLVRDVCRKASSQRKPKLQVPQHEVEVEQPKPVSQTPKVEILHPPVKAVMQPDKAPASNGKLFRFNLRIGKNGS